MGSDKLSKRIPFGICHKLATRAAAMDCCTTLQNTLKDSKLVFRKSLPKRQLSHITWHKFPKELVWQYQKAPPRHYPHPPKKALHICNNHSIVCGLLYVPQCSFSRCWTLHIIGNGIRGETQPKVCHRDVIEWYWGSRPGCDSICNTMDSHTKYGDRLWYILIASVPSGNK